MARRRAMKSPLPPEPDAAEWRRRFAAFAALRLTGLAIFLAGLAVAFSDWIRVGGWRVPGIAIAVLGLALAIIPPTLMKRRWKQQG
jgi:hypothetical protein